MAQTVAQVSNANFDTALGLWNAGSNLQAFYGNLSRVDSVHDSSPNTDIPVRVTSATGGVTFNITYNQLDDIAVADKIVREAHSELAVNGDVPFIEKLLTAALGHITAAGGSVPFSNDNTKALVRILSLLWRMVGTSGWEAYAERDGEPVTRVDVSFVSADQTGNTALITPTISGRYYWTVWFVGGTATLTKDAEDSATAFTHDFGAPGGFTVEVIAVGPGGMDWFSDTVTVTT